jgi:DUF4097 and DUF4098 domain-containing protein YvlB
MITTLLAGALALGLQQQQLDTTFAVQAGGELRLEAMNGTVSVGSWDRDEMRVRATHGRGSIIDIDRRGSGVSIEAEHRGMPQAVRFEITVPRSYSVDIEGINLAVTADGFRGNASIENVEGAVVVRGVTGVVEAESVSGSVTLDNVRGDMSIATVNQAISISSSRGNVEAETVNGSIVMRNVDAVSVEASTVNGLVEYIGTVHDNGSYFLGAHNGEITMGIPEQANARVAVATHNGRVESDFAVRMGGAIDREFSFTVGSGSARIELESYNGTIHLVRPPGR